MFEKPRVTLEESPRLYYASFIGAILFFLWGGLLDYWGQTSPTHPEELSGKIYPMDFHGTIVYLNITQEILSYALPAAGFLILIILGLVFPSEATKKITTKSILRDFNHKQ